MSTLNSKNWMTNDQKLGNALGLNNKKEGHALGWFSVKTKSTNFTTSNNSKKTHTSNYSKQLSLMSQKTQYYSSKPLQYNQTIDSSVVK